MPDGARPLPERLPEEECLRLIAAGGVGRLAYSGRYGLVVHPVTYAIVDGTIVFRTAQDSPTDEDLRTGIANAEYKVAFEVDEFDAASRTGWSVLVQGSMHHVESEEERAEVVTSEVQPWAGGERDLYLRIIPTHMTGRRVRRRDHGRDHGRDHR